MGSSPVTATIATTRPSDAAATLLAELERFFVEEAPAKGAPLLVAFSGGPDSCALLWGLARLADRLGCEVHAAHFDHRLDPESAVRARHARALAARLEIPWHQGVAARGLEPGESREAGARRLRYEFLAARRHALGARWITTAHHRDDQVETVLLRLSLGSGPAGLAGIPARSGRLVRPLLALGHQELAAAVGDSGLTPVEDVTNLELDVPRNRLRHRVLPRLPPDLPGRCLSLAAAATGARARIDKLLDELFGEEAWSEPGLSLRELSSLPPALLPWALARLHRHQGLAYPPRGRAVAELARRLKEGRGIRCHCGDGWQWQAVGERLVLRRGTTPTAPFAYTLQVPGEVEMAAAGGRLRLSRQQVAPWMWRGAPRRAALDLPLEPGQSVTVRNRRPGDRLQALGSRGKRRLKEMLIDRKMPREEREVLPLLCVSGQVAWVPGVTIHHPFRLRPQTRWAWVAELLGEADSSVLEREP
jgi:tRNA(Ile)-lysidine synthase